MAQGDWKRKVDDLDKFWDLELLVDNGRRQSSVDRREPLTHDNTKSVPRELCEIDDAPTEKDTCIKRYIIPKRMDADIPAPEREYRYENSLIHEVKVYEWSTGYNYYEDFYRDVKKYFDISVSYADEAEFFSYVPQYSQMDAAQMNRYFYFRTMARQGEFIRIDYSYVLLYCFELISSAELMKPDDVIAQLTLIWKNYYKIYPQINKYLKEWISDFGLIYGVGFPSELLGKEISELMRDAVLKEYYASGEYDNVSNFVGLIIEFCSAYNYRLSRYYEKHAALYDDFITAALNGAFEDHLLGGFTTESCNITRQSFVGAIAPRQIKKKIQVSYCSFSRTNEFRYVVGDVIKYCENKIREHVGIKSRLSVYSIDESVRGYVDQLAGRYFASAKKQPRAKKMTTQNEYEALYDTPKKEFSIADAKKIENASWETTQMLVDAFSEPSKVEEICVDSDTNVSAVSKNETSPVDTDISSIEGTERSDSPLAKYRELLSLILSGDARGQRDYARERGQMLEYLADEINTIGAEIYGDVLIEEIDGAYAPIEDYISLIEKEVENG